MSAFLCPSLNLNYNKLTIRLCCSWDKVALLTTGIWTMKKGQGLKIPAVTWHGLSLSHFYGWMSTSVNQLINQSSIQVSQSHYLNRNTLFAWVSDCGISQKDFALVKACHICWCFHDSPGMWLRDAQQHLYKMLLIRWTQKAVPDSLPLVTIQYSRGRRKKISKLYFL